MAITVANAQPVPILEADHVVKVFRRRDGSSHAAVDAVSIAVFPNECVGLVGESGSGKSTLARLLLRLVEPTSGDVRFLGQSIRRASRQRIWQFRMAVQPIFQDPAASFNPRRTVAGALLQAIRQAGTPPSLRKLAVSQLLARVRLTPTIDFVDRYPHQLSGGQRQRLALARALAMNPTLIIADEPLSGADASIRGQMLNLLSELKKDRQVSYLLITHDVSVARTFADRLLVMYEGVIVEQGSTEQVLSAPEHPYTRRLLSSVPSIEAENA